MKRIVSLAVMFLFISGVCFAQVKNYKVEGMEDIPSNKSQDEIVSVLIDKLTKQAIEKSGVKLVSYNLSKNEYKEFVKNVAKVEVKNKKVFMKKGNQQCVSIKLNVQMDADIAKNYLYDLQKEKDAKKEKELMDERVRQEIEKAEKAKDTETEIVAPVVSAVSEEKPVEDKAVKDKKASKKADKKTDKKADKKADKKVKENPAPVVSEVSEQAVVAPVPAANINNVKPANHTSSAVVKEVNIAKNNMSIDQALQEAGKAKQEVKALLDDFDKTLEESKGADMKPTISETVVSTIKPKVEHLKSFQTGRFVDENADKAKVLSVETVNSDEKYFVMKIIYLYQKEQPVMSNLMYDFSDIDAEQAKAMYNTPNEFVIEPLFSVEESDGGSVKRVLTAFNVKHMGVMKEKTVKVSTKVRPFSEVKKFEVYKKMLNGF